jgi:glutamate dehydrogenase
MHDDGAPAIRPAPKPHPFSTDALQSAFAKAKGRAASAAERDFVAQLAEDYAPDDLPQLSAKDLGALALDLWTFVDGDEHAEPHIRLGAAKGYGDRSLGLDLLQIVQGDRPFLVDSVMGELVSQGLSIRAMLHPVIAPARGKAAKSVARSVICVLVDPLDKAQKTAALDGVRAALADVYAAVEDFPAMLGLMSRTLAELERTTPASPGKAEALALLRWLEAERFVFLGARIYEYPRTKTGRYAHEEPLFQTERSLGILRDPKRGILRRDNEPAVLTSQLRKMIEADAPLVVAKANACSRVHRRAHMDYIGIKRYGPDGLPVGEVRFVGLFTAEAYDEPVRQVPLIRQKVANVLARATTSGG